MKPSIYLSFQLYWTTCKSISSECKTKKRKREEAIEEGERKLELVPAEADILRSEKKATSLCLINALGSLGSL